jgi:hypothetical protein
LWLFYQITGQTTELVLLSTFAASKVVDDIGRVAQFLDDHVEDQLEEIRKKSNLTAKRFLLIFRKGIISSV